MLTIWILRDNLEGMIFLSLDLTGADQRGQEYFERN
jgi:hypothetical protein